MQSRILACEFVRPDLPWRSHDTHLAKLFADLHGNLSGQVTGGSIRRRNLLWSSRGNGSREEKGICGFVEGDQNLQCSPAVDRNGEVETLSTKDLLRLDCRIRCMGIIIGGSGENDLLQPGLELQRRPAVGEDLRLLERLSDPSTLDANIMVRVPIAAPQDIDSALILSSSAVLDCVGIFQFIAKQNDTSTLQRLPILGFRDFVSEAIK